MAHRFPRLEALAPIVIAAALTAAAGAAAAAPPKTAAKGAGAPAKRIALGDLPAWIPPPAYRVDLVMRGGGKTFTMKRFVSGERIRSEVTAEGTDIVMIELGDAPGTTYTLMPEQKLAMKMSRKALEDGAPDPEERAPDVEIESLGEEELDGVAARKYRIRHEQGELLAWFDAASAAPLRMETEVEGEATAMEWKNLQAGPQPDKLFAPPKGYEVHDMDEVMAQMRSMGLGGKGAGGLGGMAGHAGRSIGEGMGSGLGASLGGAFGGPLGSVAGQYLGGRVGGWLGGRAAAAATPGR